jgi:type I restriction enzyme, R subunit
MTRGYTEDDLIEEPAIALFSALKWDVVNAFSEFDRGKSKLGRETESEVVLASLLQSALKKLNPAVPPEALAQAIEELTRDRSALSPASANAEIYGLIKDGVKVSVRDPRKGEDQTHTVRVLDWTHPDNNDFLLVSQFWIAGQYYRRRADLVGFVNGLPLVFVELKASHRNLQTAYDKNLTDYRDTIPHVFWYSAFIILSNGSESRIGSVTAQWEHFNEWKKINSEGETGVVSLETMIRGTCERTRLLDLVENFSFFSTEFGPLARVLALNHQYLGVNNAVDAVKSIGQNRGRLGVFWHTQGSGKSYSMIFLAQKVLRKLPGHWTFLVVTDRLELDEQIYKKFVSAGAVREQEAHAESAEHLRRLLREDHRYVFTLIHKFRTEPGQTHPMVSDRSDIIVITDESHRTQYDVLALNMRNALPNAAFIAFTGTPLIAGEEKTREVFGDYVSTYNYTQSVVDHATVRLFYENRIPELQLTNEYLTDNLARLLEDAELNPDQEKKVEREFAREYHLITREERLDAVAADIAQHFANRGHFGKAMVVCIDKVTAVRMYDKVKAAWPKVIEELRGRARTTTGPEGQDLQERIKYVRGAEMAVVVSQSQNEVKDFREKGLDIQTHRERMVKEDMAGKFKNPDDPFRLVFVCAMWMTGFDVPCCSTIYLDKPMRNHTLMQTIARANRVFGDKEAGVIVDYVGIFRNLQKALAIYGAVGAEQDTPVTDKEELVGVLRDNLKTATEFCEDLGVDMDQILSSEGFQRVKHLEAILVDEDTREEFLRQADRADIIFKAILPDRRASEFGPVRSALHVLAEKIRGLKAPVDIAGVMVDVEKLLDASIAPKGYKIAEGPHPALDLSKIDFDALRKRFDEGRKRAQAERLKNALSEKLAAMVMFNRQRIDWLERFQKLIDEYNSGAKNVDVFYHQLIAFTQELQEEDRRAMREGLSEEELALFDLLTRPQIGLAEREVAQVKKVAHDLLDTLKREKLVLDWRKKQQTRAAVRLTIEQYLADHLPPAYSSQLFEQKCELAYQHVYDCYYGSGASIYTTAA